MVCRYTIIYVKNLCHAMVCATNTLRTNAATVGGRAYFVADDEPCTRGQFMRELVACRPDGKLLPSSIPTWLVGITSYGIALADLATGGRLQHPMVRMMSTPTVFMATVDAMFDTSASVKELGFRPIYTRQQAMEEVRLFYLPPLLRATCVDHLRASTCPSIDAAATPSMKTPLKIRNTTLRARSVVVPAVAALTAGCDSWADEVARHVRYVPTY